MSDKREIGLVLSGGGTCQIPWELPVGIQVFDQKTNGEGLP